MSVFEEKIAYLKERQAAQLTGLSVSTLREWRYRGRGPRYVRVGRCVRYPLVDLIQFMERDERSTSNARDPACAE